MCFKAIASVGLKATMEDAVTQIKELDVGKVLGVAGGLLEIKPKEVLKKLDIRDEDVQLAVKKKLNLVADFLQWPFIFVTGKQPWAY